MGICRRQFGACLLAGIVRAVPTLAPRPKLLILVLLEQFRSDYPDSLPALSTGGIRKFLDRGAVYHNCLHRASSFSSSGIATLATGAWPSQHGIVADRWYDRAARAVVPASEEGFLATTLAAEAAADPSARVTVISLDRRHAALFAGTSRARLFWLDAQGDFTVNGNAPDWLPAFNAQKGAAQARDARWLAAGAPASAAPLRTLTFSPDRPREFLALYRGSPFSQAAQFDLAAELIARENMGRGAGFDLLCILEGATGALGYETGARSPLMQQLVLQLDRRLDGFFAQLARAPGEGNYSVAVAAAHGAPPEPATEARERMAVHGGRVAETIDKALAAGGGGRVEKYVYPFLYLNAAGARDPELLRLAAARAALDDPAVAGYYTAGGACSQRGEWRRRFRNSFHPARSGDVMLAYRPEYVESFGQGRGVSYGSLYNYDVRVPLWFYGPHFRAGQFEQTVESVDLAPTLARVLGVAQPSSAVGRVLGEALAE